jgi:hypothetical protein
MHRKWFEPSGAEPVVVSKFNFGARLKLGGATLLTREEGRKMFTQRFQINQNKGLASATVATFGRKLSVSVQNLVFKPAAAPLPTCENGVCSLNWKPQRPAA